MNPSVLQSSPWSDFQRALGKEVFEGSGDGWSYLAIVERTPLGKYLYVPHGPTAEDEAGLSRALTALKTLARAQRAQYVRVEPIATEFTGDPAAALKRLGLRRAPVDVQPQLTWMVDLTQDKDTILGAMRPTSRNLYRNIHKKGVAFDVVTDPAGISTLLDFLHGVAERSEFKAQSDAYLQQAAGVLMPAGAAKLFVARLNDVPIAAALSYDTESTRVYAHAAADDEHRKLNAGIPLVVTMMLDAKEHGMSRFDMWGVSPEDDPDHKWAGFSRFKRSFGGYEVSYPGTWDLPVNRAAYFAYTAARRLRSQLRRA